MVANPNTPSLEYSRKAPLAPIPFQPANDRTQKGARAHVKNGGTLGLSAYAGIGGHNPHLFRSEPPRKGRGVSKSANREHRSEINVRAEPFPASPKLSTIESTLTLLGDVRAAEKLESDFYLVGLQPTRQSIGLNRYPGPSEFSFVANIGRGQQAGGDVMSEESASTADLFEIIRTTQSMRRLKPDPVPNELIRKILEAGVCAPSGGNMQRWRFLVIRDPKIKETVGALYKRAWDEQVAPRYRSGEPAPGMSRERFLRLLDAAEYLAAHIHEAPVWIVPCLEGATPTRTSGSSIYPAVQNMLLAARALGLGATLTTLYLQFEKEAEAAFGLPPGVHSYALIPIGYPIWPVRACPPYYAGRCRLRRPVGSASSGLGMPCHG